MRKLSSVKDELKVFRDNNFSTTKDFKYYIFIYLKGGKLLKGFSSGEKYYSGDLLYYIILNDIERIEENDYDIKKINLKLEGFENQENKNYDLWFEIEEDIN